MTTIYELPQPNEQDQARSLALVDVIKQTIADQGGAIPFSMFMRAALYHPELGFYNSPNFALGREGDFTTAPEISPVFAACLARQCRTIFKQTELTQMLELGPGTGKLAADLVRHLMQLDCAPKKYYLYEINKNLQRKQEHYIATQHADIADYFIWLDELPIHFEGIVFGNEVLDALPVDCFIQRGELVERQVGWDDKQFFWVERPARQALHAATSTLSFAEGYQSEVNLALSPYLATLCQALKRGILLFADYGYGQQEYYHPQRCQGTLTCFYRHHQHENPLVYLGLQDITAHIDFTRVIDIASEHGCELAGFTTQAGFLLSNNLVETVANLEKDLPEADAYTLHQGVKTLTMPSEMGETIKFMAISKSIDIDLPNFRLQDRRREL